jgi:hypothetical protein
MDLTALIRRLNSRSEQAQREALVRIWELGQVPDSIKPILVRLFSGSKFDEQLYLIIARNPCAEFSGSYLEMLTRPNFEWQAFALKVVDRWIALEERNFREALEKAIADLKASSNLWIRFLGARASASFLVGGDEDWNLAADAVIKADFDSPPQGIRSEIADALAQNELAYLNRILRARGEEEIDCV